MYDDTHNTWTSPGTSAGAEPPQWGSEAVYPRGAMANSRSLMRFTKPSAHVWLWLKTGWADAPTGMLLEFSIFVSLLVIAINLARAVDVFPVPTLAWWVVALGVALAVSFRS